MSALQVAAEGGHIDVAELLLRHGAIVNAEDDDGWTALYAAARARHTDMAELLLRHGAYVNIQIKSTGINDGDTALHQAAQNKDTYMIELLLKHGASVDIEDKFGRTALSWVGYGDEEMASIFRAHGIRL